MVSAIFRIVIATSFTLLLAVVSAQGEALTPAQTVPDDMTWVTLSDGLQVARIAGDLTKPGMYTVRVKFPAGLKIQPHFHSDERIVIVLEGTVYFAYGELFDEASMNALPTGSVWTEPAKQPHFAWAKDGETVIQVIGNGPSATTPIRLQQ